MRLSTLLLISAFLGSCSSDSAPVFTDVNTAIDQADSAKSAGDTDLAKAGYEYARDNGDGDSRADALMGLFELGCAGADDDMAFANFETLTSSTAAELSVESLAAEEATVPVLCESTAVFGSFTEGLIGSDGALEFVVSIRAEFVDSIF